MNKEQIQLLITELKGVSLTASEDKSAQGIDRLKEQYFIAPWEGDEYIREAIEELVVTHVNRFGTPDV